MVECVSIHWQRGHIPKYNPSRCLPFLETIMNILLWLYKHFYTRKDQNVPLYKEYLLSEAEMEKQYVHVLYSMN